MLRVSGSLTKAKTDDLVSSDEALFTDDSGLADSAIGVGQPELPWQETDREKLWTKSIIGDSEGLASFVDLRFFVGYRRFCVFPNENPW